MKIKFLGTGSTLGIPVWNCNCKVCTSENKKNKRYRSSLLVQTEDKNILIDFGQDCRTQLIKNNIKHIDYAFLTHAHLDHCHGYEVFSTQENCTIEAPDDVLKQFYDVQGISGEWLVERNKTLVIKQFEKKVLYGIKIDTVKVEHKKDYSDTPVPCYGYIFDSGDFKFAYLSDYNEILEPEKLENIDLLISDGASMNDRGRGHIGVKRSIEIYKNLKAKRLILTHINHSIDHEEAQKYVKQFGNIDIAYDGMEITD